MADQTNFSQHFFDVIRDEVPYWWKPHSRLEYLVGVVNMQYLVAKTAEYLHKMFKLDIPIPDQIAHCLGTRNGIVVFYYKDGPPQLKGFEGLDKEYTDNKNTPCCYIVWVDNPYFLNQENIENLYENTDYIWKKEDSLLLLKRRDTILNMKSFFPRTDSFQKREAKLRLKFIGLKSRVKAFFKN